MTVTAVTDVRTGKKNVIVTITKGVAGKSKSMTYEVFEDKEVDSKTVMVEAVTTAVRDAMIRFQDLVEP